MPYLKYVLRPIDHAMNTERPSFFTPQGFSPWAENVKVDQKSIKKRWGYAADRSLGAGKEIQRIVLFQTAAGARLALILTDTDLIQRETATGKTWSYKTETYTTGTVTNITAAVVTGSGTSWDTSGLAAGDKFILDTDHTADVEEDAQWAEIQTVDNATQITLTASYGGTTGAMSETYKGRMVYSVPTNERWNYALVNDNFYFTNGDVDVQYWTGSGTASAVDSTNAKKARYCIEYAQRLVLADLEESGSRSPLSVRYSANGDPTTWTGTGTGVVDLLETEDYITGLGKVGADLIVYKSDSIIIGSESGKGTEPIYFLRQLRGIGLAAPNSLVHFMGTNAFIGRNDFYVIESGRPIEIRPTIRDTFFTMVDDTEVEKTFGFANHLENQIEWIANTSEGQKAFVWDWDTHEWTIHDYACDITAGGKGAI